MQLHGRRFSGVGDGRRLQRFRTQGRQGAAPKDGTDNVETIKFNYKDVINGGSKPFYLRSGDTVIVP
jgi:hypothetical protein